MYKGWQLPGAARLTYEEFRLSREVPVNGGGNSDRPKVAKFIGH